MIVCQSQSFSICCNLRFAFTMSASVVSCTECLTPGVSMCPDMCDDLCQNCWWQGLTCPTIVSTPLCPDMCGDDCRCCCIQTLQPAPEVTESTVTADLAKVTMVPEMFLPNFRYSSTVRCKRQYRFSRAVHQGAMDYKKRLATLMTRRLDGNRCACGSCVASVFCDISWNSARTIKKSLKRRDLVHHGRLAGPLVHNGRLASMVAAMHLLQLRRGEIDWRYDIAQSMYVPRVQHSRGVDALHV